MTDFKVGDRVADRTSGDVFTVDGVGAYGYRDGGAHNIVLIGGVWRSAHWFEPAPPEKPKYRLTTAHDDIYTRAVTPGGSWLLYAYAPLSVEQQQAALRAGMAALGYEEQQ